MKGISVVQETPRQKAERERDQHYVAAEREAHLREVNRQNRALASGKQTDANNRKKDKLI
jgi:hypothetical protein